MFAPHGAAAVLVPLVRDIYNAARIGHPILIAFASVWLALSSSSSNGEPRGLVAAATTYGGAHGASVGAIVS